ncbi:MAG: DinB family protein [Chitinophagaceae bacterium]
MSRPSNEQYPPFYETYVKLVQEENLLTAFSNSFQQLKQDLSLIGIDKAEYAYAPGKWTVKQLLQHAIDTERIFGYRALCISRTEHQSLPGFDENVYAEKANAKNRHLKDLKEEMLTLRLSTIQLFQSFDTEMINRSGLSNQKTISVLALGYIIIGHWRHHAGVLQDKYGIGE